MSSALKFGSDQQGRRHIAASIPCHKKNVGHRVTLPFFSRRYPNGVGKGSPTLLGGLAAELSIPSHELPAVHADRRNQQIDPLHIEKITGLFAEIEPRCRWLLTRQAERSGRSVDPSLVFHWTRAALGVHSPNIATA